MGREGEKRGREEGEERTLEPQGALIAHLSTISTSVIS